MRWALSWRADPAARVIADRHYNRQSVGAAQFVQPGRCLVLLTEDYKALWVTSWPFVRYVKHAWAGAWMCSCFRNEGAGLSSELITEAVAATRAKLGEPPALGFVTFVDRDKTRRKRDPGRCYRRAGWHVCGETAGGLVALQLLPNEMPLPEPAHGTQGRLVIRPTATALSARLAVGAMTDPTVCDDCDGAGQHDQNLPCYTCGGTGKTPATHPTDAPDAGRGEP